MFAVVVTLFVALRAFAAEPHSGESPADHLPPHITRLTSFGERADWSHDGKKLLFLSKTFGDAMELNIATGVIRNLTAHYPHHGYTRALYLANGDILLAGPLSFDPNDPGAARWNCYLYVLDKSGKKPAAPLSARCNEGPAVSRKRMHIAWTEWGDAAAGDSSQINSSDVVFDEGTPKLANLTPVLSNSDLGFRCRMETQNFRPPEERELIFSAYTVAGDKCDVCGVDLATKQVTKYTDSPEVYDEPEGILPDGHATLVECDSQNRQGPGHIDIWKLALNPNVSGSGKYERLTFFSDYPGYKASNPVVSDDGRWIAFQMGQSVDAAGVGHGIFIYDLEKADSGER
ncbi:MAG: hypothetical protein WD971_08730 [Pirellulales bacterium]